MKKTTSFKKIYSKILLATFCFLAFHCPQLPTAVAQAQNYSNQNFKGWGNLANALINAGLSTSDAAKIINDPRLPLFQTYTFSVTPREPVNIYAGFVTQKNIAKGRNFIRQHLPIFYQIKNAAPVSAEIVTAILLVETDLGRNTGKHRILYRLARLANCADPQNVQENYLRLKKEDPTLTIEAVRKRALELQELFIPEIFGLMRICQNRCDPYNVYGSAAGAFGIPQFIPTSFEKHALDFNRDGLKSLFQIEDSLASVANYFANHGWQENSSNEDKKAVIWHYNRSQPYVDTVFQLYQELIKAKN